MNLTEILEKKKKIQKELKFSLFSQPQVVLMTKIFTNLLLFILLSWFTNFVVTKISSWKLIFSDEPESALALIVTVLVIVWNLFRWINLFLQKITTFSLSWSEIFQIWQEKKFFLAKNTYSVREKSDWQGTLEKNNKLLILEGKLFLDGGREINFISSLPLIYLKTWQENSISANIFFRKKTTSFFTIIRSTINITFGLLFLGGFIFILTVGGGARGLVKRYRRNQEEKLLNLQKKKNRVEQVKSESISCSFADIGGYEHARKDLEVMAKLIKEKKKIIIPRGIVLYGPPGTGKTLFAKSFAKAAGLDFFQTSGKKLSTNFVSQQLGSTKSNLLDAFDEARDYSEANGKIKVILFIDEYDKMSGDGIAGDISMNFQKVGSELLDIMGEGVDSGKYENVILIITTNHIRSFNRAALRSGRLERKYSIGYPSTDELEEIIQIYLKKNYDKEKFQVTSDFIKGTLIRKARKSGINFVGADIKSLFDLLEFVQEKVEAESINEKVINQAIQDLEESKKEVIDD